MDLAGGIFQLNESSVRKNLEEKVVIDQIVRSNRKTLSLTVNAEAQLIVRAPNRATLKEIDKWVQEKKSWIVNNQVKMQQRLEKKPERQYETGELFMYLGETHTLSVSPNVDKVYKEGDTIHVPNVNPYMKRKLVVDWYQYEAGRILQERIKIWSAIMDIPYHKIRINFATTRWASCSQKANLNFTTRLIMAPLEVVDYVVVHELSHVHHKNHGKDFWNLVSTQFPNYALHRRWLREHSPRMVFE